MSRGVLLRACLCTLCVAVSLVELTNVDQTATAAEPVDLDAASVEKKIRTKLDASKSEFDFQETPLEEVVDYLGKFHAIEILLDEKALDEAGIERDTPVTIQLKGVTIRSALRHILRPMDLAFVIKDEALLITTSDVAENELRVRVYDVRTLLEFPPATKAKKAARTDSGSDPSKTTIEKQAKPDSTPANGVQTLGVDVEPSPKGQLVPDGDGLIALITSCIQPTTWDEVGGPGSIVPFQGKLVVSQTDQALRQIRSLIDRLHEAKRAAGKVVMIGEVGLSDVETATEKRIQSALDSKATFDFQETPLRDVVAYLSKKHKVTLAIDTRALDEAGIEVDTPITKKIRDMRLTNALKHLLRPMDLKVIVKDEVLLITTPEVAEEHLTARIYPVGDLADLDDDFGILIQTIVRTVSPTTWDEVGGPGSAAPFAPSQCLVIQQTGEVHDGIADLLTKLRVKN